MLVNKKPQKSFFLSANDLCADERDLRLKNFEFPSAQLRAVTHLFTASERSNVFTPRIQVACPARKAGWPAERTPSSRFTGWSQARSKKLANRLKLTEPSALWETIRKLPSADSVHRSLIGLSRADPVWSARDEVWPWETVGYQGQHPLAAPLLA